MSDSPACCAASAAEKMGRGALKSAVERLLTKDRVVIADGWYYWMRKH